MIGLGVIYNHLIAVVGAVFTVLAMFGWALEPSVAAESDYEPPSDDTRAASWPPSGASHERRRPTGATPPDEKTPGHGAPDLGNEPSEGGGAIVETIDEIPMGGLPGPGPVVDEQRPARTPTG